MTSARIDENVSFLNSFDEGIVVTDQHGTITFFNAAAEHVFGYDADAVVGQPLTILIPEEFRKRHPRQVAAFCRSDATSRMMSDRGSVKGRRRNGEVFDAEVSISKRAVDGEIVLTAVVRDVSERSRAERQLKAAEERLRAILDTCNDAIIVADSRTGLIVEVNTRAAELFGCNAHDLIGVHQSRLHPESERDRHVRHFREHVEEGRVLVPDGVIERWDGRTVPVEIAARPTEIDGVPMIVGYFRDITHRRLRERMLTAARQEAEQANASKSMFLASISHELRTPLNGIIGLSDLIRSEAYGPIDNPRYAEYLADIKNAGEHLLAMLNEVLDLSRIEAGRFTLKEEEVALVEVAEECTRGIRNLFDEAGVELEIDLDSVPHILADRRAVYQMLLNLVSNAIKHTPAGGHIVVEGSRRDDGGIVLAVADSGVGIAPERLAEITQPFNADGDIRIRNQPNLGLGLAITKGLIESHDGTIEIESEPGVGTRVSLIFPPERTVAREPDAAARASA